MARRSNTLIGTIKRHPDGFGFFIPSEIGHPDVYIPKFAMMGAFTNDKVEIEAHRDGGPDRFKGKIIEILERRTKNVVGKFTVINDKYGLIKDEGKGWGEDLKVLLTNSMEAKDKEIVAAEILKYPDDRSDFEGRIIEKFGDKLDPISDIRRVLIAHNIPTEFSKATLEEAKKFDVNPSEKDFKNRKDIRDLDLITIDGATAKDFDDAIYVEKTNKGFKLLVAIADVSHYVTKNSAIDKDAFERGTSVYFPNYVVPMLPEALSNGLCSLNPKVPRLCVVAEMHFDFQGEMMSSDFYEAVMESKSRCTYGEAQEVIDGVHVPKHAHVKDLILRCADLAKILMSKRFREGSLDLEIPETQLVIDGAGVPIDIQRTERLFAHRLIEEMMLAANVAVGKFLSSKEIPALYRVHEQPNEQSIRLLESFMKNFGGGVQLYGAGKLQKQLTKALEEFKGKPEAIVLNILTLRSMTQAKYQMENVGHFGLGFEFYTHFTSPIRRYPDLIVHRLLKSQIMKGSQYKTMSEDELLTAGTMLSACEQRSVKAERQVQGIKKARFMEKFLGEEFEGMISSVAKFGVFVLLREYDIDGLVRLDDLGQEQFEFDDQTLCLIATRSGRRFSIGDTLKIQVAAVDTEMGQINFVLGESLRAELPEDTRRTGSKANRASDLLPSFKGESRASAVGSGDSRGSGRNNDKGSSRSGDRGGSKGRRDDRGGGKKFGRDNERGASRDKDRGGSSDRTGRAGMGRADRSNQQGRDQRDPATSTRLGTGVSPSRLKSSGPRKFESSNENRFGRSSDDRKSNSRSGKFETRDGGHAKGSSRPDNRGSGKGLRPAPIAAEKNSLPDENLLKMILGPDYKKVLEIKDKLDKMEAREDSRVQDRRPENKGGGQSKKMAAIERSQLGNNNKLAEKNSETSNLNQKFVGKAAKKPQANRPGPSGTKKSGKSFKKR